MSTSQRKRTNDGATCLSVSCSFTDWQSSTVRGRVMGIESMSDECVLRFYEDIRQQVAADLCAGNRYRFMGEAAKHQAERLRIEIARRRLRYNPIEFPDF